MHLIKSLIFYYCVATLLYGSVCYANVADFYKNIALTLYNEKNPICREDADDNSIGPSYFLNNSPDESICYYFICSLYWMIYKHESNFPDNNNILEKINTEENYILLSDFFEHIIYNYPKKKEFKSEFIEIRQGIEQKERIFCIKMGNNNTQQYTFTFSQETLLQLYDYRDYCTRECLLRKKTKEEAEAIYAAQFYLNTALYCSSFSFYSPGIFFDNVFLNATPY